MMKANKEPRSIINFVTAKINVLDDVEVQFVLQWLTTYQIHTISQYPNLSN